MKKADVNPIYLILVFAFTCLHEKYVLNKKENRKRNHCNYCVRKYSILRFPLFLNIIM